ncbi:MAG: T9SS type A sorting domain-containing protein [Saprospiraceae bacterium]
MRTFTTLIVFAACILCAASAFSQQVYQANHYGGIGTIYLYNRLTAVLPGDLVSENGDSVVWDLRDFTELNTHPNRIVTPSEGIDQTTFLGMCGISGIPFLECFSIWSNTDQALLTQDSLTIFGFSLTDMQRYQNKTSNLLLENFFGFTVDLTGEPMTAAIVYAKPDTILRFPVAYENQWISRVNWSVDLTPIGQNTRYKSKQTRTSTVDAWGTIITPYDTFTNVIRVKSAIQHQDTLYQDSLTLPINITQVEYSWYDTLYKLPVMTATGIVTDSFEVITVVEYIYEATCAAPTWTVIPGAPVFYLDSSGTVTVNFVVENSNADEYTWDFGDGPPETSTGDISHTFSISGDQFVYVVGCMTNCLPLNSCSDAIVEFTILDTISSIDAVPGSELGIKLYPNPVNDVLSLEIPIELGTQHYKITDITGRNITTGMLQPGKSSIKSDGWLNGMYTLQIWKKDRSDNIVGILRFAVLKE